MSLADYIRRISTEAINNVFSIKEEAEILPCNQEAFGHYQCNNSLKLAKELKQSPREIARSIVENIQSSIHADVFEKIEIAGPGFINFHLHPYFLSEKLLFLIEDPHLGVSQIAKKEKVIVEFSSPNIAKELHVGHLRSTIIGECLARVFSFIGMEVLRLNHIGDWGTQFGMLIAYIKEKEPEFFTKKNDQIEVEDLMKMYRSSKKLFDEDPSFKKRAQEEVVKLQSRDEVTIHNWEKICAVSRKAFQDIYQLLDVNLIERGESFYNPFLKQMISTLEKKKLITISDGAKCIYLEGFVGKDGNRLPLIVQKSDGGYNYSTTELAALEHRIIAEKADQIIIVTDAGQTLHFKMIFQAAEKAGFYNPANTRLHHVAFGLVLGENGKKFKTRSGETEKLIDLLQEAIRKAKEILEEKNPDINPKEKEHIAKVLGIAAVKYADLSTHRLKDYVFSYDRMLRFDGNTAIFLLYSYVRIQGIKRKVNKMPSFENANFSLQHPSEIALAFHLLRFDEVVHMVAKDLLPNRLTDYLYTLAEKFNGFFRDCRVEGSKEEKSRLILCEAAGKVLKQGLYLLGIQTVDRM